MTMEPRSARWLLWSTYFGFPLLVAFYVGTSIDGAMLYGWRYVNPISWGFPAFVEGCRNLAAGAGATVIAELAAFYRSDPWGNWVLVDHMGLKVLLSFVMFWEAKRSGSRAWPYIVALYVVGALAPLLFFFPLLREAASRVPERGRPVSATSEVSG